MNEGLEALKKIEKELSKAWGIDIAYDEKVFKLFSIVGKELQALDIIRNIGILKPYETSGGQCWLETMCDATKITKDNYDLLKKVGL